MDNLPIIIAPCVQCGRRIRAQYEVCVKCFIDNKNKEKENARAGRE